MGKRAIVRNPKWSSCVCADALMWYVWRNGVVMVVGEGGGDGASEVVQKGGGAVPGVGT